MAIKVLTDTMVTYDKSFSLAAVNPFVAKNLYSFFHLQVAPSSILTHIFNKSSNCWLKVKFLMFIDGLLRGNRKVNN